MHRTLLLASMLFATACSDHTINALGDANGANGPRIQVDPEVVDFGLWPEGEVGYEIFTITNIGEGDLHVEDIELGAYSDGFTILTEEIDFMLPAGASQDIEVSFTPYGVNMQTKALISSNDSEVEVASVDLLGQGQVPELKIDPDPYDYGKTYVGCAREGIVNLSNIGTGPLTVNYIDAYNDGQFLLEVPVTLPYELQPGDNFDIYLDFDPDADLQYSGELSVTSTEPMGTRIATQTGEGKYTAVYKDDFEVPVNPPADIMFLVDQSCSMDDDQQRLQQNFSYFISNLNSYTTNWQIMVVNADTGCSSSGVLTKNTTNYQQKFNTAVTSAGGYHTESLLTPAAEAVHKAGNSGCNAGFMRQGALLHIIPVSDEPEQSAYTNPGSNWSSLVQDIQNTKGSPSLVKISAIVGDYPGGCASADAGTGYYEAVNYTGGEFLSICASNWSSYMPLLAEASISMDTFELTATPVENTIEVRVNGNTVDASAWEYDSGSNSVRITQNPPEEGDTIRIVYAGLANCD